MNKRKKTEETIRKTKRKITALALKQDKQFKRLCKKLKLHPESKKADYLFDYLFNSSKKTFSAYQKKLGLS